MKSEMKRFVNSKTAMGRLHRMVWLALVVAVLAGCKPKIPSRYIQPDVLEDILYDYHQALAAAPVKIGEEQKHNFDENVYCEGVLKKYGITSAEFDSSMVYYCRHTSQLHAIYERLSERLNKEAVTLGASVNQSNHYFTLSENGDTADIWRDKTALMLVPQAPYNQMQFSVPADTTFRPGDKMMLNFGSRFLFQDGVKDGVVMLCLRLQNDSVAQRVMHVSSNSNYSLSLIDDGHLGIKEVFGFFYLSKGNSTSNSESTLKIMFIDEIRLIRMREKMAPTGNTSEQTSGSVPDAPRVRGSGDQPSTPDSMKSAETPPPPPPPRP
jgi:hypothetical protein